MRLRPKQTLKRQERLKKERHIADLFTSRQIVGCNPVALYWKVVSISKTEHPLLFGVSVPKKKLKKAVDRNLVKRRIREVYRTNKHIVHEVMPLDKGVHLMIVYLSDQIVPYVIIERAMQQTLYALREKVSLASDTPEGTDRTALLKQPEQQTQ